MNQLDLFGPGPQGELFRDLEAILPRAPNAGDVRRRLEAMLVQVLARGSLAAGAPPAVDRLQARLPGLGDPGEASQPAFGFIPSPAM